MKAEEINSEVVLDKIWTIINKSLKEQGKELLLSCSEMQDIEHEVEQYAELRIQQEREKWKEEVIKAYHSGQGYEAYKRMKLDPYPNGVEYYESVVKPRIESK